MQTGITCVGIDAHKNTLWIAMLKPGAKDAVEWKVSSIIANDGVCSRAGMLLVLPAISCSPPNFAPQKWDVVVIRPRFFDAQKPSASFMPTYQVMSLGIGSRTLESGNGISKLRLDACWITEPVNLPNLPLLVLVPAKPNVQAISLIVSGRVSRGHMNPEIVARPRCGFPIASWPPIRRNLLLLESFQGRRVWFVAEAKWIQDGVEYIKVYLHSIPPCEDARTKHANSGSTTQRTPAISVCAFRSTTAAFGRSDSPASYRFASVRPQNYQRTTRRPQSGLLT